MKRLASYVAYGIVTGLLPLNIFAGQGPLASLPDDGKLPVPPRQSMAWTPPASGLPKSLVSAATKLFQEGLADPRGCEYREIELFVLYETYCRPLATHGWVLPAPAHGQRFAVGWNGVVCPVTWVGPQADLRKDVLAMIAADAQERAEFGERRDEDDLRSDEYGLSLESMHPLKACLLLRLGEGDLAARSWNAWKIGTGFADPEHAADDPYPTLFTWWTNALLDQAVRAHARYDDSLALASLRMLAAVRPAFEAAAEAENARLGEKRDFPPLAAVLLADQQRRLALRKAGNAPPLWTHGRSDYWDPKEALRKDLVKHFEKFTDDSKVVPELIHLLEECNDSYDHLFINVLINVGDDAVEPLLACLENDRRLSRAVCGRSVKCVAEVAIEALDGILQTGFNVSGDIGGDSPASAEARKALAGEMRAYWKKFKDVPLAERWYRILGDDTASAADWLDVARNITSSGNSGARYFGPISRKRSGPGQRPVLHGDVLRDKRHPSVTELMIRRVETLSARKEGSDAWFNHPLNQACEMASFLARWDVNAALPVLRRQTQRCRDAIAAHGPAEFARSSGWGPNAARFIITRAEAGDRQALEEYAAWIRGTTPQTFQDEFLEVLSPLWRFPQEKATKELADWLFTDPASPWNPLGRFERMFGCFDYKMIQSPLLAVPAFRQLLLKLLADRTVAGSVAVDHDGKLIVSENDKFRWWWGSSGSRGDSSDPRYPPKGTVLSVRTCDVVAADLHCYDMMRPSELYWPEADRDRAVAACADVLKRYGACFVATKSSGPHFDQPTFTLPPLDHPATSKDVEEGRAIFSLASQGEVRAIRFARLPQLARWTAFKQMPIQRPESDPKTGKPLLRIEYEQRGQVWQGEEVRIGNRWQRYFGFVGLGGMHKIPAEEIEFECTWDWKHLDASVSVGICWPGIVEIDYNHSDYVPLAVGDPLPVRLAVENHKGTDVAMPRFFDATGTKPASGGIAVRTQLLYTPDDCPWGSNITREMLETASKIPWTVLKAKRGGPLPFSAAKDLGPAERADVVAFDMAQWFPIEKPGTYRLRFEFDSPGARFEPVEVFMGILPAPTR
ncbi:MAG: hypothetical protein ACLQNE_00565 [Thermoguttaceae bacterium]